MKKRGAQTGNDNAAKTHVTPFKEDELRSAVEQLRPDYLVLSESSVKRLGYTDEESHALSAGFSGYRFFGTARLNSLARKAYTLSQAMYKEAWDALLSRNESKRLAKERAEKKRVIDAAEREHNYRNAATGTGQFIADFMLRTKSKTAGELAKGLWEVNGGNQASRDVIRRMFLCKPDMNALQVVQAYAEAEEALFKNMEDDKYLRPHPSWVKFLKENGIVLR